MFKIVLFSNFKTFLIIKKTTGKHLTLILNFKFHMMGKKFNFGVKLWKFFSRLDTTADFSINFLLEINYLLILLILFIENIKIISKNSNTNVIPGVYSTGQTILFGPRKLFRY